MNTKQLGKTEIKVSPLGLGCWAIGGPFKLDGIEDGWGEIDDRESITAIHSAIEMGITFFDTSDAYGTGHSEEVLGKAVRGRRNEVIIATKFGYTNNMERKEVYTHHDVSPEYVRQVCENSLQRLGTDYIDLYQIHIGVLQDNEILSVIDTLNRLKQEGAIRSYGWSTWDVDCAENFAKWSDGAAIQHTLNVLRDEKELVSICERYGLSSICNTPLAMGLLSGKFHESSQLPTSDVRGSGHEWVTYFRNGKPDKELLTKLDAIREILTSDNRSLVQGALGWIWGKSDVAIPIPGFKTKNQVEDLAKALYKGPLSSNQMNEIDRILKS